MTRTPVHRAGLASSCPPYPVAVPATGLIFLSGIRAGSSEGVPGKFDDIPVSGRAKKQGFSLADHDEGFVTAEAWSVHEKLEKILNAAGSTNDQLLRMHIWQRDKRFFPCHEAIRMVWQPAPAPSSGLGVGRISGRFGSWIGVDGIAVGSGEASLFAIGKVVAGVDNVKLPSAAHYSQLVQSGPLAFTAGHIAIKTAEPGKPLVNSFDDIPLEGRFLATGRSHPDSRDGPIAAQAWYVLNELRSTLSSNGLSLDDVIHATVFLSDLRDFATFHRVHHHFFRENPPSLCVTGFNEVGHRGCRLEIELTALKADKQTPRAAIGWPIASPFLGSAATGAGPLIFYSGMLGLGENGELVFGADALPREAQAVVRPLEERESMRGLAAQCWAALNLLRVTAKSAGSRLEDLVKTTVYIADEEDLNVYEAVRASFLSDAALPAFECVVIHGPGPVRGAHVQIEAIGVRD